jgi:hypothetical protein
MIVLLNICHDLINVTFNKYITKLYRVQRQHKDKTKGRGTICDVPFLLFIYVYPSPLKTNNYQTGLIHSLLSFHSNYYFLVKIVANAPLTSVSRLGQCSLQQSCCFRCMSGLAFNLHVENKSITTLFHKEH